MTDNVLLIPAEESTGPSAESGLSDLPEPHSDRSINSLVVTSSSPTSHLVYHSYKRRWYILLMFSLSAFLQGYFFNMWGPIYDSMKAVFGWSHAVMALLLFYGTFILAPFSIPSAFVLEKWGLRTIVLLMSSLALLSTIVRCIPTGDTGTTVLVHVSCIINAFAGLPTFFIPPVIASKWFPPHERRMATAIGECLNALGFALAFLIGPAIVHEPGPSVSKDEMKNQYYMYTYGETGVTALVFCIVLLYFPDKPPTPPSETAQQVRFEIMEGVRRIVISRDFWYLCVVFSLLNGTVACWLPVLSINLGSRNVDQIHAGWIGFYSSLVGTILGIFACRIAGRSRHLKAIQFTMCLIAAEGAMWILFMMNGYIPFSLNQVYVAAILLSGSSTALIPFNFELAIEILYPIDEALIVATLSGASGLWASVFLIILMFPVGTAWMDWFMAVCTLVAVPFSLMIREKYKRAEIDVQAHVEDD